VLPLGSSELGSMWSVFLTVLQPIGTSIPGGIAVANVKLYVNLLNDYELVVPTFQGKKLIANSALKSLAPSLHASIGEGRGSAIAGKVASVAEVLSKVPIIGSFAGPVSLVARGAESILDFFGFTRKNDEKSPSVVVSRSVTNVARVDGTDPSEMSALSICNSVTIDPAARGFESEDCMSYGSLFPRWTLIKTFDWTMLSTSDEVLATIPVTPSYGISLVDPAGDGIHFTTAGFVGLPFAYWRGGMKYKILIPVSKMHRGALQIIWVPIGADPTVEVTNRSLNRIVDISCEGDINISIGFARDEPYLQNRIVTDDLLIFPTGTTNGFLSFKVVNPLVSQSETANTRVFVFACADTDMDFAMPRDELKFGTTEVSDFVIRSSILLQGKALGDDLSVTTDVVEVLVPPTGTFPSKDLLWGETINSVRSLMQKPSMLDRLITSGSALTSNVDYPNYFLIPGIVSTTYASILPVWTWAGYYRALFYGISGSERYKIFPKDQTWVGVSRTFRRALSTIVSTMSPMTFSGSHRGCEFVIPYYQPRKFVPSYSQDERDDGIHVSVFQQSLNTTSQETVVYYSLGPDVAVTSFRQVPKVIFTTTPLAVTNWF